MIIQRIDLENFRPFYGKTSIDLSVGPRDNVILFKGQNDTGKTSLFEALKFCLYGEHSPKQYEKHVNRTRRVKDDGITSVTLIFTHNNENYQVTRTVHFRKTPLDEDLDITKNDFQVIKDGVPEDIQDLEGEKRYEEYFLPEEASQFFFFDGEKIQGYTQNPPHPNIKSAIEILLGIKELLNARDDLQKVKTIQEEIIRNELGKKQGYESEKEKLEELSKNKTNLDQEIINIQNTIADLQKQKDRYENDLRKYDEIREVIEAKSLAEKDLTQTKLDISNTLESIKTFNDKDLAVFLVIPFLKRFKDEKISTNTSVNTQLKKIASEIILDNSCICGRDLDSKSLTVLKKISENQVENKFQGLDDCTSQLLDNYGVNQKQEYYLSLITVLNSHKERRNSLEAKIQEYNDQLGSKANDLDSEYKKLNHEYQICSNNLTQRRIIIVDKTQQRDDYQKQYDSKYRFLSNKDVSKEYEKQDKRLLLIKLIIRSINELIDEIVKSRKIEIEKIATKFLREITNAPEVYTGIELDADYKLHLRIKDATSVPAWDRGPSAGQSQVIAHSFIAALNKFTAKEAPIIIDTPLARLDDIHTEKIVRSYPSMGKQVIILYQPRELDEKLIGLIKSNIRSEYEIKRDLVEPENSNIVRIER